MHGLQEESKFDDLALTRISELQQTLSEMEGELDALRQRQAQEQQAVTTLLDAEQQSPDRLPQLATELGELQDGGLPLVYPWVDDRVVAEVLSDWTGIPTGRMLQSDLDNALNLNQLLSRQIFGQQTAIDEIAQAVRISRAGIQAHDRPLGVFMLSGPSGVGKTETAFALAEAMYGGAHNLIVFNMSEFQESHTVSTLKGAAGLCRLRQGRQVDGGGAPQTLFHRLARRIRQGASRYPRGVLSSLRQGRDGRR